MGEWIDFAAGAPVAGSLDVRWNHGVARRSGVTEPPVQVHPYDEHTVLLRQSLATNHEGPFLALLFGNDRALLLDTGATAEAAKFPLRETVDGLVAAWLQQHPRDGYELVVAHTHAHGDHVAGDAQLADRPGTTVVGHDVDAVRAFFGFGADWTSAPVTFDLGGRVLEVLGTPGHHETSISVHDPWSGILFTGDTVLPGRLMAFDYPAFLDSLDRLVALTERTPVSHVLGCHVEMTTTPGRDYPLGTKYQPDEVAPQLTVEQLRAMRDAARSVADQRGVHRFDEFLVMNEPRTQDLLRMVGRGLLLKLRP